MAAEVEELRSQLAGVEGNAADTRARMTAVTGLARAFARFRALIRNAAWACAAGTCSGAPPVPRLLRPGASAAPVQQLARGTGGVALQCRPTIAGQPAQRVQACDTLPALVAAARKRTRRLVALRMLHAWRTRRIVERTRVLSASSLQQTCTRKALTASVIVHSSRSCEFLRMVRGESVPVSACLCVRVRVVLCASAWSVREGGAAVRSYRAASSIHSSCARWSQAASEAHAAALAQLRREVDTHSAQVTKQTRNRTAASQHCTELYCTVLNSAIAATLARSLRVLQ